MLELKGVCVGMFVTYTEREKKTLPFVIYIGPDIVKILHILPYLNFTPNPVGYY